MFRHDDPTVQLEVEAITSQDQLIHKGLFDPLVREQRQPVVAREGQTTDVAWLLVAL